MSTKNNQSLVSAVNVEPLHQDEANKLSGGFQTLESTNVTSDSEATNVDTVDIHIPRIQILDIVVSFYLIFNVLQNCIAKF